MIYRDINNIEKVFNKIDYFSPVLYEDYLLVKNKFKPKYIDWNIRRWSNKRRFRNILLGNSFENNHIEAIDLN